MAILRKKRFTLSLSKGFTLIETILYIALFSLMMSGVCGVVWQLMSGSQDRSLKLATQEEGIFVIDKLNWALTGTSSLSRIISPAPGTYADELSLMRADGSEVDIKLQDSRVVMRERGSEFEALTSAWTATTTLQFYYFVSSTTGSGIEALTTINGSVFYTKKYFPI